MKHVPAEMIAKDKNATEVVLCSVFELIFEHILIDIKFYELMNKQKITAKSLRIWNEEISTKYYS